MLLFFAGSIIVLLSLIFETWSSKLGSLLIGCIWKSLRTIRNCIRKKVTLETPEDYGFVYSDDLYNEINFSQLYG